MKCNDCDYQTCGDDECDYCDELISTGLCTRCHKEEDCHYCHNKIDLKKDNFIQTVGYAYFCNKNCYEHWKL